MVSRSAALQSIQNRLDLCRRVGTDSTVSKLSVFSQRENVLSAIGAFSRSSSSGISQDDIVKILEKSFYPLIQQEVHDGLIGHMLQQMAGWCPRLTAANSALTEFFKVRNRGLSSRWSDPYLLTERSRKQNWLGDYTNRLPSMYAGHVQG